MATDTEERIDCFFRQQCGLVVSISRMRPASVIIATIYLRVQMVASSNMDSSEFKELKDDKEVASIVAPLLHIGTTPKHKATNWPSLALSFIGQTIEQVADFVAKRPHGKDMCMSNDHFVVFDLKLYRSKGWATVCKIIDGTVSSLACGAKVCAAWIAVYHREQWHEYVHDWLENGWLGMEDWNP